MSESDFYDVIIIGGGPGGLTAGIYCMRAAMKTALIGIIMLNARTLSAHSRTNHARAAVLPTSQASP